MSFFVKNYAKEFNFLYNWNRATIEEKMWVRVKFAETTKMNAYRLGSRELKPLVSAHSCNLFRHRWRCISII